MKRRREVWKGKKIKLNGRDVKREIVNVKKENKEVK